MTFCNNLNTNFFKETQFTEIHLISLFEKYVFTYSIITTTYYNWRFRRQKVVVYSLRFFSTDKKQNALKGFIILRNIFILKICKRKLIILMTRVIKKTNWKNINERNELTPFFSCSFQISYNLNKWFYWFSKLLSRVEFFFFFNVIQVIRISVWT
jgi:hypothetical protein